MPEKLFRRYLEGDCSKEEVRQILQYFRENPLEIERYFSEEEWKQFCKINTDRLPEHISQRLLNNVETLIKEDKSKRKRKALYLISGAVAATFFLFILFNFLRRNERVLPVENTIVAKNTLIKRANSGISNLDIVLRDGTKVVLYPHSEIQFDSLLGQTVDIYLTGKAKFEVQHDTSRIFKVWCGDIVTTDIGTIFVIDVEHRDVRVDVFEGKISVAKSRDSGSIVYLNTGQFAIYKSQTKALTAGTLRQKEEEQLASHTNKLKNSTNASIIRFRNDNLKTVLDRLSAQYKVTIEYPTEKVSGIRLNMAIDTSQNIEDILKNIAIVGDLQLTKENDKKYILQ